MFAETGKVFTWGRADYGQLGRTLGSPEAQKHGEQDSSLAFQRLQNSVPSPLHCLTGAAEVSGDFLLMQCAAFPAYREGFPEGFPYTSLSHDVFIQESEGVQVHKELMVSYDRKVGSWLPTCPLP